MIYQVYEAVEVNGHVERRYVAQSAIRWVAQQHADRLNHHHHNAWVKEVA